MDIRVKDHSVLKELLDGLYHTKLTSLAIWVCARLSLFTITSGWRKTDSGVHGTIPCRGMDIRSDHYPDPAKVALDINNHWEYDESRPHLNCAVYHDAGNGWHIHLQVSDRTKYFSEGRRQGLEIKEGGLENA